jgi:SHS2 domain-containing protein
MAKTPRAKDIARECVKSDDRSTAGHRLVPHTADCIIEAWGSDRAPCLTEALCALVEEFAEVPDAAAPEVLPLGTGPGSSEEVLVTLFEDVIYALDVFSVVPVRFHLAETEGGGIAGDMEVVPADQVVIVGPVPKAVSYHELGMDEPLGATGPNTTCAGNLRWYDRTGLSRTSCAWLVLTWLRECSSLPRHTARPRRCSGASSWPLELELASRAEVAGSGPDQLVASVEAALSWHLGRSDLP